MTEILTIFWHFIVKIIKLFCRPDRKLPWKSSVCLLLKSWKKLDPFAVSLSEKQTIIINCSTERLTVRKGSTFSWNVLKRSSLKTSAVSIVSTVWVKTCLSMSVFTLSSLVSDTHQLDFLSLTSASYSIMFPPSCGCYHGSASLKGCKYTSGGSAE